MLRGVSRNARGIRLPERERSRARLDQHRVGVAVVAPLELHDLVPPREPPRKPDGAHRRLGPRGDEPDLLDRGKGLADQACERDLPGRGRAVARPPLRGSPDCGDDLRVGVAEDHRAPGGDVVEEGVPVRVGHGGPLRLCHEEGCTPDRTERPNRRVDPPRDHFLRLPEQFFRDRRIHPDSPPCPFREREKDGELYPLSGQGVKGSIRWNSKRFSICRKRIFRFGLTRREPEVYILTFGDRPPGTRGAHGERMRSA